MSPDVFINCLLIIAARVADVTLGTVRTVQVMQGRRSLAFALGFVEVLIWIMVVSRVVGQLTKEFNPYYAVSYALGFATGNFLGITIEQRLAMGYQVVRVFSRGEGSARIATALREQGIKVTEFEGRGRDGPVTLLWMEVPRRRAMGVAKRAREIDPRCYYVIEDIRVANASYASMEMQDVQGSAGVSKSK